MIRLLESDGQGGLASYQAARAAALGPAPGMSFLGCSGGSPRHGLLRAIFTNHFGFKHPNSLRGDFDVSLRCEYQVIPGAVRRGRDKLIEAANGC